MQASRRFRRHARGLAVGVLSLLAAQAYADQCPAPTQLFHKEYLGACGYTQTSTFPLSQAAYVTRIRIWYDSSRAPQGISATLTKPDGTQQSQQTEKGGCYAGWCEGNFIVNNTLAAGTYTVTANLPYVCKNPSGDSTLVVYGCTATAQTFGIVTRSSGDASALSVAFDVLVDAADIGRTGSVYLAARVPVADSSGVWFLNNGRDWAQLGSSIPAFYTGPLSAKSTITMMNGGDARALTGVELYAGYGRDAVDMLSRGHFKQAYVFPAASTPTTPTSGSTDVKGYIDGMMGMVGTSLSGGLTDQLAPILQAALSDKPSTCPVVSKNFSLANASDLNALLSSLPSTMTASASYGNGCTPSNGIAMGGTVEMTVSNFALNLNAKTASGRFAMTATNLSKQGKVMADGRIEGSFSGSFTNGLQGNGSFTLSNFLLPNNKRVNGTVTATAQSSSSYSVDVSLQDSSQLAIQMGLTAQQTGDDILISTRSPGTVGAYSVTLQQVRFNTELCKNYPIGGSATFSRSGQSWTATFNSRCDGSYTLN